ncbi:MAG: hypothetical protein AAFX87_01840 [Bacteroidota bacterium]
MSKSSKIYNALSEQQKQFIKEKTISATFKVGKWLAFLNKASAYDALGDKEIKTWGTRALWSFIVAFISLFLIGVTLGFSLILTALLIAFGIFSLVRRKQLKNKDISNYLRMFLIPVLHVMKEKAGEDTKMAASLDFRNPRKALAPEKSKVGVRKLKLYQPKYIIAKVELKDSALLEVVIADDVKDFSWTKTNARGKTKFKNKTKYVHYCFIKMTLPKSEYKWLGEPSERVTVIDHNGDYIAKMKGKLKTIGKDNIQNVKVFFDNMQEIYSQFEPLNPAADAPVRRPGDHDEGDDFDDTILLATPYIWYGSTFDSYDYDSFDQTDSGDFVMDDDSATVFDS